MQNDVRNENVYAQLDRMYIAFDFHWQSHLWFNTLKIFLLPNRNILCTELFLTNKLRIVYFFLSSDIQHTFFLFLLFLLFLSLPSRLIIDSTEYNVTVLLLWTRGDEWFVQVHFFFFLWISLQSGMYKSTTCTVDAIYTYFFLLLLSPSLVQIFRLSCLHSEILLLKLMRATFSKQQCVCVFVSSMMMMLMMMINLVFLSIFLFGSRSFIQLFDFSLLLSSLSLRVCVKFI